MAYKQTLPISYKTALVFLLVIAIATVALVIILYHTIRAKVHHVAFPMKTVFPWIMVISLDLPLLIPAQHVVKLYSEKRNVFTTSLQTELQGQLQLTEKALADYIFQSILGELGHFSNKQYVISEIEELFPNDDKVKKACADAKEKVMQPLKDAAERGKKRR